MSSNTKMTQRISNPNFIVSEVAVRGVVAALHALMGTTTAAQPAPAPVDHTAITQRIPVCSA